MARTIAALQQVTDEELIHEHDAIAPSTVLGTGFYMEELTRRANERATKAAQDLAVKVYRLTIATTVLSVIAVVVAVLALFS